MASLVAADVPCCVAALCLAFVAACSSDEPAASGARDAGKDSVAPDHTTHDATPAGVTPPPAGQAPWTTLAEWHLFADPVKQLPADRVIPYSVNSQLFADYATKHR